MKLLPLDSPQQNQSGLCPQEMQGRRVDVYLQSLGPSILKYFNSSGPIAINADIGYVSEILSYTL